MEEVNELIAGDDEAQDAGNGGNEEDCHSYDDADRALLYWEDYYPGIACRIYSRTKSVDNFHTALASNSNPRHK